MQPSKPPYSIFEERLTRLTEPTWERPAIGLMLRYAWSDILDELTSSQDQLTWLEVFPENYFRRGGVRFQTLRRLAESYPITSHGVHLSIGGDRLDDDYLRELANFLDAFDCPWASDHLGVSMHEGEILHEILPAVRSERFVELVGERLGRLAHELPCDFCLENAAYYFNPPGCELSELDFLRRLIEEFGLQLIFDVNNLWVNACNHGYDPDEFLAGLPDGCVRQIHIGGFSVDRNSGLLIDTHASLPSAPVWDLLESTLRRFGPRPVLLEVERDNVPVAGLRRALEQISETFAKASLDASELV